MDKDTFDKFRELVYARSGITLHAGKEALVSARVGKRLRALNMADPKEYLNFVINDDSGEELVQLLDAISTNVTSFFREAAHFEHLHQTLTGWIAAGQRRFRVWCAASSTGEEPYTIAMMMREAAQGRDLDMKILATDISTRVLRTCLDGLYDKSKVAPVAVPLRNKYFTKQQTNGETLFRVSDDLRKMITFRRLNLSMPPFPMHGPLDFVFCRNVMIYFDNRVRGALLQEVNRLLKPKGILYVGHAESLTGMVSSFRTLRPSVYVKST